MNCNFIIVVSSNPYPLREPIRGTRARVHQDLKLCLRGNPLGDRLRQSDKGNLGP